MIKGYETLTADQQDLFNGFYKNFCERNDTSITPISVYYVEEFNFCGQQPGDEELTVCGGKTEIIKADGNRDLFCEWSDPLCEAIKITEVDSSKFLRFDYLGNHKPSWQHVINSNEWY
jgi:hypothetical protein